MRLTDYATHKNGEDWAPAIQRAFEDSPVVHVPAGRYPCSQVKLASGTTLQGTGAGTVFIPRSTRLFNISGTTGEEHRIGADIVDFSDKIHVEDNIGFVPGDDILIRGQRNSMLREGAPGVHYAIDWVLGRTRRTSCFFGEMDVVEALENKVLTTRNKRLFPDYFKDNSREPAPPSGGYVSREATTVSRLTMATNIVLRNFAIEGTATCYMPVRMSYCKDCLVENIAFTTDVESHEKDGTPELSLVYGIYAKNTTVRKFTARLSPGLLAVLDAKGKTYENFSNYNLFKMISSTASGFEQCEANGGTHAFNITRSGSLTSGGGIPSVHCFIRNCIASNCVWSGMTVQQGCYNTEVSGNTVTSSGQGIITGGRNTRIESNRVSTEKPLSTDYYYTHISRGGTFGIGMIEGYACGSIVRGNTVEGFYSGIAVADGYEEKNCFEEGDLRVENNTVSGCVRGFTLYKNPHCASLGRKDLKIRIVNNRFTAAATKPEASPLTCGIYLPEEAAGVDIGSNTFRNFHRGVSIGGTVDFITISSNHFVDCGTGVTIEALLRKDAVHVNETNNTFTRTAKPRQGFEQAQVSEY